MSTLKSRLRRQTSSILLEALEPRQLLSGNVSFVLSDSSMVLLGSFPGKKNSIAADDSYALGPRASATIQWGDGSSSPATLQRDANNRIQVWGGHAYADSKTFKLNVTVI